MTYVAVAPGLGEISLSVPKRSVPFTPSPTASRDATIAKAKALAKMKLEAQARGKKDATSGAEFMPKVLTQLGVDAQAAGVPSDEVAAAIESAYKAGWASVKPLPAVAAQPPPPTSLPVGLPQPLASIFVKKLTELVAKGLLDEEVKDLQKLLPMAEEQLRALVATVESKGKKGAAEVRAAFEQSITELAAMKADESKKKVMVAGAIGVAAVAAFLFMRRKKS